MATTSTTTDVIESAHGVAGGPATVDAHCGYDLPWSPFSFIPLFGGALMHDYHHSSVFGNYGATVIWDRLMGTELKEYRKLRLAGKLKPPFG